MRAIPSPSDRREISDQRDKGEMPQPYLPESARWACQVPTYIPRCSRVARRVKVLYTPKSLNLLRPHIGRVRPAIRCQTCGRVSLHRRSPRCRHAHTSCAPWTACRQTWYSSAYVRRRRPGARRLDLFTLANKSMGDSRHVSATQAARHPRPQLARLPLVRADRERANTRSPTRWDAGPRPAARHKLPRHFEPQVAHERAPQKCAPARCRLTAHRNHRVLRGRYLRL